jgi:NAD(P)H dehydrogenase (quinone)
MAKVLVLYYSSYGHIETMAKAVAEGAREAGAIVDIKRVPETAPEDVAKAAHFKLDQDAPVATDRRTGRLRRHRHRHGHALWPHDLADGQLPRPGRRPVGARRLNGKVGGAFTSTATQHGGQETTLFSIITNLLHFGMVIVGLDYGHAGQMKIDEVTGGSPYGATTIAGGDGSRQPTENELVGARYQGRKIAETAIKLHG